MAGPREQWVWGDLLARFTIPGEPAAKGNSREIVQFGDRAALRKGDKALAFDEIAGRHVPRHDQPYEGPVGASIRVFYASGRPDLDASLVYDAMQNKRTKAGKGKAATVLVEKRLIKNDRQVVLKHEERYEDRDRPRVEVAVFKVTKKLASAAVVVS